MVNTIHSKKKKTVVIIGSTYELNFALAPEQNCRWELLAQIKTTVTYQDLTLIGDLGLSSSISLV